MRLFSARIHSMRHNKFLSKLSKDRVEQRLEHRTSWIYDSTWKFCWIPWFNCYLEIEAELVRKSSIWTIWILCMVHKIFLKIDLILGQCPEDHIDVKRVTCQPNLTDCSSLNEKGSESLKGFKKCRAQGNQCPKGKTIFKAHGPLTGYCVPSDR